MATSCNSIQGADMITLEQVAQLRKDLEENETKLCEQSEIIYQLNLRNEELSCRTPRPDWAAAFSKGWPDVAAQAAAALHSQNPSTGSDASRSTRLLVATAADKLVHYCSALQVILLSVLSVLCSLSLSPQRLCLALWHHCSVDLVTTCEC